MLFAHVTIQTTAGHRMARMMKAIVLIALAMLTPAALAQLPCSYEADIVYGPLCGDELSLVSAFGISEEGDICGDFECAGGFDQAYVAWDAATLTPLAFPPDIFTSRATDVEAGRVVGNPGFLFEGDKLTTIPPLPGGNTVTVARINASRVIVGSWGDTVKGPFPLAFRWENGVMHDLSPDLPLPGLSSALDINDQGAITGWMGETPQSSHAFIWQNGKATDIGLMPGSFATQGWGISNRNQICGTARFPTDEPPGFVTRGFIWERGIFTDLGLVGSFPALHPRAINDDGTVVGHANFGSGGGIGFVWKAGVLRRITDLLPPNVSGGCTDINSRGEIALSGNVVVRPGEPSEQVGVRLRPIPREPGDTNCDGMINLADLIAVLSNWGQKGSDADVNGTGLVDVDDLIVVILNWG